jgi:hypothetical protein
MARMVTSQSASATLSSPVLPSGLKVRKHQNQCANHDQKEGYAKQNAHQGDCPS